MARSRQGDNLLYGGIDLSDSGKHDCKNCRHGEEGFCKAMKKFGYLVSDDDCKKVCTYE